MNWDAKQRSAVDGIITKKMVAKSIAKKRYDNIGRENMNLKNVRWRTLKEKKTATEVKKLNIFALKCIFVTSLEKRNKSVFYGTLGRYALPSPRPKIQRSLHVKTQEERAI